MRSRNIGNPRALWPLPPQRPGEEADQHASRLRGTISSDRGGALWPGDPWLAGIVPPAGGADEPAGPLSRRGQRASGGGAADGGALRRACRYEPACGSRFDVAVAPGGYVWWYLDAISDDARYGLTLIAFLGSVFSPFYARARRRGRANPFAHAAFNIALYGGATERWAFTEYGERHLGRGTDWLTLADNSLAWHGDHLAIEIAEWSAPWRRHLRGHVRVYPTARAERLVALDDEARHVWSPIAPIADIEVVMTKPALSWSGRAYLDSNAGDTPLEAAFSHWHWSRAHLAHHAAIFYDVVPRVGMPRTIALQADDKGGLEEIPAPPATPLARTGWRIARAARADPGTLRILKTLEDTPFYARSMLAGELGGTSVRVMHESLFLDRFRAPWVQFMLPFRMRRIG